MTTSELPLHQLSYTYLPAVERAKALQVMLQATLDLLTAAPSRTAPISDLVRQVERQSGYRRQDVRFALVAAIQRGLVDYKFLAGTVRLVDPC